MDKKLLILFFPLLILLSSCNETDLLEHTSGDESDPYTDISFTRSGDADDVSILAFRKDISSNYLWTQTFEPVWTRKDATNTYEAGARIQTGDYQFLFYKHTPDKVSALPDNLTGKQITDILFQAEGDGVGYVKPVDEIFMPGPGKAVQTYRFVGAKDENRTIACELHRAVSQVQIYLVRGEKNLGLWKEFPYDTPATDNILNAFKNNVSIEIKNVATSLDINGGVGSTATKFSGKCVLDTQGFAIYESPFVFPNRNPVNSEIKITLTRSDGTEKTVSANGTLSRNQKLVVTVYVGYTDISFTVSLEKMKDEPGDDGIWGGGVS